MFTNKKIWNKTILSRDTDEHENFVREIIDTLGGVKNTKYKVALNCIGWDYDQGRGPMIIGMTLGRLDDIEMTFNYIDCVEDDVVAILRSRIGRFLEGQGYSFNPMTNAIMCVLHEMGHVEFNKTMFDSDIIEVYNYIYNSNHSVISMTIKGEHEQDLIEEGVHVRYLLNGDEMYCDGFAMTYFRPVVNRLIEKGFPEHLLYEEFKEEDKIEYKG